MYPYICTYDIHIYKDQYIHASHGGIHVYIYTCINKHIDRYIYMYR